MSDSNPLANIPLPLINDPILGTGSFASDDNKANQQVQAQIDALKKADAKIDEKIQQMQNEKQFDQALGAINNQLAAMGKAPVQAQNPFSQNKMPTQLASGSTFNSTSASPVRSVPLASYGSGGGVGKV
ncbi:MAG: hypothetical protein U1E65_02760 [Myxococcota bacterium]